MIGESGGERVFDLLLRLKALNEIGVALSAEQDSTRLLEMILEKAMFITFADGGTLYTRTEDDFLKFEIILTNSLDIHKGGTSDDQIILPPLRLYDEEGDVNCHMVAVCAAIKGKTINISDIYENTSFEFSGTQAFDKIMHYRSKSVLTVPMKNNKSEVIGILQLVNAVNPITGETESFTKLQQELVESLTSQATMALVNQKLLEDQRHFFDAFIQLIAGAIDDKSPYTGGHCRRVPELTMMLAKAAIETKRGPLKHFSMTEEDLYTLKVAGWLHDCGKIVTPEHIVDKATKLETIFDRIHLIDARYEVLKRDAEIALLREQLAAQACDETIDEKVWNDKLQQQVKELNDERNFLHNCNQGREFMSESFKERVYACAQRRWVSPEGKEENFLSENEIYNLNITKGTLTPEERKIIMRHIESTISMLESLPYPKSMRNVPEYAGGHHEHMNGKGYPKGLTREQMSIPARMMGIADVFEALTARDRPYKTPMTLSRALIILGQMKEENHIDPDLFDMFVRNKIYMRYAKEFLDPSQIDEVDERLIPGYNRFAGGGRY